MSEPKWIRFVPLDAATKTPRWQITTSFDGGDLGLVKFYPMWRKFVFFPSDGTLYEADCLRDIAAFCEEQTRVWRTGLAESAAASRRERVTETNYNEFAQEPK